MNVRGIIFDFDGVIVDNEVRFTRSVKKMMKKYGHDATEEELLRLPGKPISEIARLIREMAHLTDMSDEEFRDAVHEMYRDMNLEKVDPIKDAAWFMELVRKNGIRTAVATSAGMEHITDAMEQADLHFGFDEIVTHADVTRGKPDPEIFLKAAEKLNLPKEELVIFEDSYNGVLAAKRSGIFTVGLKASAVVQNTSLADIECTGFREAAEYLGIKERI